MESVCDKTKYNRAQDMILSRVIATSHYFSRMFLHLGTKQSSHCPLSDIPFFIVWRGMPFLPSRSPPQDIARE